MHQQIKGQTVIHKKWESISAYARTYTALFARTVAKSLVSATDGPLVLEEMVLGLEGHERPEMAQEALRMQKRYRVTGKMPPETLHGQEPSWSWVFRQVSSRAPRVGNGMVEADDELTRVVDRMVPDMDVRLMQVCRGTDRHRRMVPRSGQSVLPWRRTFVVDRASGEIRDTGPAEEWTRLSRLKQLRPTGPARLSLTVFGYAPRGRQPARDRHWKTGQTVRGSG